MKKILLFILTCVLILAAIPSQAQQKDLPPGQSTYYTVTSDTVLYLPRRGQPLSWNSSFAVQIAQADTTADTAVVVDLLHSLIDTVRFYVRVDDTRLPYSLTSDPAFIIYGSYLAGWYYALKITGYVAGTYYVKAYLKAQRVKN